MGICDSQNGASLPLGTHCVLLIKPERSLENESMALQTSLVQSTRSWGNKAATETLPGRARVAFFWMRSP